MVTIFLNCLNKMENADILRTEGLFKKYHNRTVVNDVSIQVKQGEIVGLLVLTGRKTTSFYMIVGLIKPLAGKIFINDKEITICQCITGTYRYRLFGTRGICFPSIIR